MFTAAASRYLLRGSSVPTVTKMMTVSSFGHCRTMASLKEQFEEYGKMVFTGKIADDYLNKHGATGELLKDPTWVNHSSDTVAAAVFDWYVIYFVLHKISFFVPRILCVYPYILCMGLCWSILPVSSLTFR
jgi:hypothetical protein